MRPSEAKAVESAAAIAQKPRPAEHVVKSGEDIYQIASAYGLDAYALAMSNGLNPPFTVSPGQRLKLPPTEEQVASGGGEFASDVAAPSSENRPANETPTTAETPAEHAAAVPVPQTPSEPQAVHEEGFIWPVSGDVISEFGPKGNGLFNDGINIAATRGAPVRAAESGIVAYAGNELRGFGNMLLIKHADGWVTAYAHADELLVSKGERVSKGQVIARIGSTGSVSSPQLHFEMRKGKKAVDPLRYLRRSNA